MAEACLRGLSGESDVYECSYVASDVTDLPYFATKVRLGPSGAEEVMPIGDITEYESEWLAKLKVELKGSIRKGHQLCQLIYVSVIESRSCTLYKNIVSHRIKTHLLSVLAQPLQVADEQHVLGKLPRMAINT